MNSGTNQSEKN